MWVLGLSIVLLTFPATFFFGYIWSLFQPYPEDMYDESLIDVEPEE